MSSIPDNNPRDAGVRHESDSLRIEIIVDEDVHAPIDLQHLRKAAIQAASRRGFDRGEIGIRVTTDAAIQQINREHLGHDYPTDVISFAYRAEKPVVEGELVLSACTAESRASELGWPASSEMVLYVVHGTLHIAGMEDHDTVQRRQMRQAEQEIMLELGIDDIVRFGADDFDTGADDLAADPRHAGTGQSSLEQRR